MLTVYREGGTAHILDLRAIGYDLGPLGDVLAQAAVIAYNAKFDLGWLLAKCGIHPAAVFCICTCTASRLLLAEVAAAGLDKVMELEMDLLPVVVDMERTGVGIDIDQLKAIRTEAEATTRSAEAEVRSLLDAPDLNLSSPKQLLAALNASGFDLPNTAEETLKGAADESGVISALLRHRSAQKAAQQPASLIKAVGRDGRLRCSFNPSGTATGRFSSSRPNLQNIGRGAIRSAFTPAPGKCVIVADYSQIELRIAARYKGLSRWHSKAWEQARAQATEVRTRLGRRRLIPAGASEWKSFTTLVNTEVQGGAADGMKLALVDLAPRLTAGIEIISTVHDELIVEAPAELAKHVRDLTQTVMIESMARLYPEVPIEVEAHICAHWGEKS